MLKILRQNNRLQALQRIAVTKPINDIRISISALEQAPVTIVSHSWGYLSILSLIGSFGFLLISIGHNESRSGASWAEFPFWIGLLLLLVPTTIRLLSIEASRQERIGLVTFLGLAFYLTKILHSPYAFTFSDELHHVYNLNQILQTHHLFHINEFLPATAFYPSLPSVAAALVMLTGMSEFSAGLIVIGISRLILSLALFLFHERISGSARVAGIASVIYMSNSTYLFWSTQFSYESLALPLTVMFLLTLVYRVTSKGSTQYNGIDLVLLLTLATVIITHHMTSYALTMYLWSISVIYIIFHKIGIATKKEQRYIITLALVSSILTSAWLLYVASPTIDYLSPILIGAAHSMLQLLSGEASRRLLFHSSSGSVAPLWQQIVSILSVALIVLGLPFGLLSVRRYYYNNAFALLLAMAALIYFPMLVLRLTDAGWETSNRASEFLFLGISFVIALGMTHLRASNRANLFIYPSFAGCIAIVFIGGVIAGWQPNVRLAQPYLINAGTTVIEPPGVTVARWTRSFLGSDNRMAMDRSNAKLELAYGEQNALTGTKHGIYQMFFSHQIGRTEKSILELIKARYILVDRRLISWDQLAGIYFNRTNETNHNTDLLPRDVYSKFDRQEKVSRILDSGNIVIYDLGALSNVSSNK